MKERPHLATLYGPYNFVECLKGPGRSIPDGRQAVFPEANGTSDRRL